MKIYSMTATFGKLNNETLTLQPGLSVIEAPNEWGKSTWCAFLQAMFYGINTREQTKTGFLADKEHYAPWSGAPMSGRMDICWNGRDITIERRNKGRGVFNDFKAYETVSGIPVAELTAANCGQMLLGVEQSVFARAGFIRLKDLPVTQDESLRRRLNSLVTTGDESDHSDDLAQKLKDLKNRCRFNKSGLLPQAEAQCRELTEKLREQEALQQQIANLEERQAQLKEYTGKLQNHKQALDFAQNQNFAGKLAMAKAQLEIADDRVKNLEILCAQMPNPKMLELKKLQIQQLKEKQDALQMEIQLQPPAPAAPAAIPQFQGVAPQLAVQQAQTDAGEFFRLMDSIQRPNPTIWIVGLLVLLVGVVLMALAQIPYALILGVILTLLGFILQFDKTNKNKNAQTQARILARRYSPIEPDQWAVEAKAYADAQEHYEEELNDYRNRMHQLEVRLKAIYSQVEVMTGGKSALHYEQELDEALAQQRSYADAVRERSRLEEMVSTLTSSREDVLPPEFADELDFDMPTTLRLLSDAQQEQRQLHQRLGQYQGRQEALGDPQGLQEELSKVNERIAQLEKIYNAAVFAQQTLLEAKLELQRRFAPRISQRAQELFGKLTNGRYERITLGEDFSLSAAAQGENTLYGTLWRSDGTVDQLYLALRLAVAEELTPDAPLVLDDAFVRFDDKRLACAMEILLKTAEGKQVILFTCQSREKKYMEEQQ